MTTIHDVAARAGVSSATVSRVLNGNASVNDEMAERVRAAIEDMQYRPSNIARSLRTQRTGIIAVVVPDIENPFFTSVVRGVEDVARGSGLLAVLCNSDDEPLVERTYLSMADDQRVDGVILASSVTEAGDLPSFRPALVLVDRRITGVVADSVVVDNRSGAREATRHLLACGAQRPACITGPRGVFTAQERLAGFFEALEEAGVPRSHAIVRHADFRTAGGRAATDAVLSAAKPPDAMFVCNNQMTLGALEGLAAHELSPSRDLLFVGYDDESWSSSWNPAITSVAQPARDLGKHAMRLLMQRLAEPDRPIQTVTLQPTLKLRASSVRG